MMAQIYGSSLFLSGGIRSNISKFLLHALSSILIFAYLRAAGLKYLLAIPPALLPLGGALLSARNTIQLVSGKEAEEKVVEALSRLDDRFRVIRNYRYPGGDIDVLVIGPSGVFVLEVKRVRGKVKSTMEGVVYGGKNFYEQLMGGVDYISRKLPEYARRHVKWAVVVDGGKIERKIGGKPVLRWWDVPRFVSRGRFLSEEDIEEVMEVLGI